MGPRPSEVIDADYVIVVGGRELDAMTSTAASLLADQVTTETIVIAADSGIHLAQRLHLRVDHLVGDFDSASAEAVESAARHGATVHRHPADKDATDFELAVDLLLDLVPDGAIDAEHRQPTLLVIGPGGGRLDHLLADVALLGAAKLAPFQVSAAFGDAVVVVMRPGRLRRLPAAPGAQASLLPVGGSASGITTTGLRWPLVDADLAAGSTRAVSSEVVGDATVSITGGVLAAVIPGGAAPAVDPRSTPYDPTPRSPR